MANSRKFASQEDYWKDYHGEQLPPAEEKEKTVYKYDDTIPAPYHGKYVHFLYRQLYSEKSLTDPMCAQFCR
mgnify:CR=1 FL=1